MGFFPPCICCTHNFHLRTKTAFSFLSLSERECFHLCVYTTDQQNISVYTNYDDKKTYIYVTFQSKRPTYLINNAMLLDCTYRSALKPYISISLNVFSFPSLPKTAKFYFHEDFSFLFFLQLQE